MTEIHAVTGPFSYSGRYIADRLRAQGIQVRGLARRTPSTNNGVDVRPLQFENPAELVADLEGSRVLYNTYWIRFERGGSTFAETVQNTGILADAASKAGVERIVHLSVSNPSQDSPFAYFRGKAAAELAIRSAGVPVSVIRPTLVFGNEDILINNIAWMLRRFRAFPIPRRGESRVQPVFVADVAGLAVDEARPGGDRTIDAAGPEVIRFADLLKSLARAMSIHVALMPSPPALSLFGGAVLSRLLGDVAITDEEIGALLAETLISNEPATCHTRFSDWVEERGSQLGRSYTSELKRHWNRTESPA